MMIPPIAKMKVGTTLNGTIEKRFIFPLGTPIHGTPFMVQYSYYYKGLLMAASVHNFILTYNELNIIQGLLYEEVCRITDENSINSLNELRTKIQEQRDSGYPAKDYPYWRKYFQQDTDTQ